MAVGVVQDGAPEFWHLLPPMVVAEPQVTQDYEAIDRYHLNDHLAAVLRVLEPDAAARAAQLSRWNDQLDHNDKAIYLIRETIRTAYADAATRQDETTRTQLEPHVTYLDNNASLMRYARLRAVGLSVGSGVTEARLQVGHSAADQRAQPAVAPRRPRSGLNAAVNPNQRSIAAILGPLRPHLSQGSYPMQR